MKHHWIATVLIAAFAGAAGATLAHEGLSRWHAADRVTGTVNIEPEATPLVDWSTRMQALESRVSSIELRPEPSDRRVVAGESTLDAEFKAEVRAWMAESRSQPGAVRQAEVEETLYQIREAEQRERALVKDQQRAQKTEYALEKLSEQLGLRADQVDDMRVLYDREREAQSEVKRMWAENPDPEVVGQVKADRRREHNEELARILTPDQLATLRELRSGK